MSVWVVSRLDPNDELYLGRRVPLELPGSSPGRPWGEGRHRLDRKAHLGECVNQCCRRLLPGFVGILLDLNPQSKDVQPKLPAI